MKLGWAMITEPNALWVIMRAKYNCGGSVVILDVRMASKSSHIWRVLVNNWDHIAN